MDEGEHVVDVPVGRGAAEQAVAHQEQAHARVDHGVDVARLTHELSHQRPQHRARRAEEGFVHRLAQERIGAGGGEEAEHRLAGVLQLHREPVQEGPEVGLGVAGELDVGQRAGLHRRRNELLLGLPASVDGGEAAPGGLGDITHAQVVPPLLMQEGPCGLEDRHGALLVARATTRCRVARGGGGRCHVWNLFGNVDFRKYTPDTESVLTGNHCYR